MEENPQFTDILLYTTSQGKVKIEVIYENETFWLSQKRMGELFDTSRENITMHLKNIFSESELNEESVCKKFLQTAADGKNYNTQFYNLDAVIAVGYRVNSLRATQFRIWATKTLKDFIVKGFVLDDERLKGNKRFGVDYFTELLERIREIRASERRFYQKITDIFAECSLDYDSKSETTQTFYKTVQNKLEWAITGKTAAEIIAERANAEKVNMGLSTWKKAPDGKVVKSDAIVAKNYLIEKEILELNRVITMYLDYAENQAQKQKPMYMHDWIEKLDAFLKFNDYEILTDSGRVTSEVAKTLAISEYEKYRIIQDQIFESDFDKEMKKIIGQ
jgi:hypothetical protein